MTFHSEGEQLAWVFEDQWSSKQGLLRGQMSLAVILPLTGKELPTLILLFGGEAPGGCLESFLPPDLDGFLNWKKVHYLEKAKKQTSSLARHSTLKQKLLILNNLNGVSIDKPLIWALSGLSRGHEGRKWIARKAAIGLQSWLSQRWPRTMLKIKNNHTSWLAGCLW